MPGSWVRVTFLRFEELLKLSEHGISFVWKITLEEELGGRAKGTGQVRRSWEAAQGPV